MPAAATGSTTATAATITTADGWIIAIMAMAVRK